MFIQEIYSLFIHDDLVDHAALVHQRGLVGEEHAAGDGGANAVDHGALEGVENFAQSLTGAHRSPGW